MIKSNRIMCLLLIIAFSVLVLGQNIASASEVNNTNTITPNLDDTQEYNEYDYPCEVNEKSITKNVKGTVKESSGNETVSLYMEDVEVDYGDCVDMNVITTPVVDDGILSWYIKGGLVGNRNLSVSPASYQLDSLEYRPGNYSVTVVYEGSSTYSSNTTTASLKINPANTRIDNIVTGFDEYNNIIVELNVLSGDEILDFGTLNVYYEDNMIEIVEIRESIVEFTIDKTYNQEILCLEYMSNRYYQPSKTNILINVPKYNINLYLAPINEYYGNNITKSVIFYSSHPVDDGLLDVYVDGVLVDEYNVKSDSVEVSFSLDDYEAGSHTIYLMYYDSDVYEDTSYQSTLSVKKVNTVLRSYNVTAHKNESVTLRAYVYNYVDEDNEGLVEFFIDQESIETLWIRGVNASVNYIIPDAMNYSLHELKSVFYGSDKYESSMAISYLNVTAYSNSLSVNRYYLDGEGLINIDVKSYSYNQTVDSGVLDYYVNDVLVGSVYVTSNITQIVLPTGYEADNEYIIRLDYHDSDKFENASLTRNITPVKYDTSTRLYTYTNTNNILNITSYVYSTSYDQINEGIIEFYINDTIISTSSVINNQASTLVNMSEYPDNTYSIKAIYNGTRIYKKSENNTDINYNRYHKTIYIQAPNIINKKATEKIGLNINLTDYEGNIQKVATYVTINILNTDYPVWTENGQVNFEYKIPSNTAIGSYPIIIRSEQTTDYKNTTRTIQLNIYKDTPYITSQNIKANKKENVLINATLNLNNNVLNENITGILKINNKTIYQGIFKNGQFQYKLMLTNYTNSQYNITIKSKETALYHSAEKNIILNLNTRNTYILSKNIESKNGEKIIINATVYDSITRTPITGTSKICIKINDVTLDNVIINNGQLLYTYTNDYSTKEYTLKIIHGENGIYSNSTWNGTLTIKSSPLKIATKNIQTRAYENITIKADIFDNNKLAQGLIKTAIKINNKTIAEVNVTNAKLEYNYKLPEEIGSGTYNLTIIAGNSRKYASNTTTVKLIVNKNYQSIKCNDITLKTGQTIPIQAKLVDINNKSINKNTKINIKIAGHTILDYNITDGSIEYNYTPPSTYNKGTYDLLIQAGENSGYYHASTYRTLKIE